MCNAPSKTCNAPPKTCNDTSIPAGPFLGGITHLITPFEGFIEYLEFNTAKTDEFDVHVFYLNDNFSQKFRLTFKKNPYLLSFHATYEKKIPEHKLCHRLNLYS